MTDFLHSCKWCRKTYTAKRSHSVFCSTKCRVTSHRILKDFKLFDEWVDEETVKAKYYIQMPEACVMYLQWFRVKQDNGSYNRFADVYMSKGCPLDLEKKLKRMKIKYPIRYTSNK